MNYGCGCRAPEALSILESPAVHRPKLSDIETLVRVLEENPFGSLVLVLLTVGIAFMVWVAVK